MTGDSYSEARDALAKLTPSTEHRQPQGDELGEKHSMIVVLRPQLTKAYLAGVHVQDERRPIELVENRNIDGIPDDQSPDKKGRRDGE